MPPCRPDATAIIAFARAGLPWCRTHPMNGADMRIENYGQTWSFTPQCVATPTRVEELARIVRDADKVRVMGAAHSWSQGIVTEGTLVSLDAMSRILHLDAAAERVTVQAGIRLSDLITQLEERGMALANLGSIATQSLAGAIATGTHGTGIAFKCLADQVQSLSLIDGRGEKRVIDREHPDFAAIAVGLGAFGIIYEMTLSIVPTFQMHAITEMIPFDDLVDNLDHHVRAHDHFKLWWLVPDERVIVFRQRRTQESRNDSDFRRWFKDEFLGVAAYRAMLALQKVERRRMVQFTNRIIGREYGKRFERICKSHVAFLTPEPPVHRETEWAFDYANAADLLRAYRKLLLASDHSYSFIQEIRFTAADPFWASPAYGRDSIWLSLYNIDRAAHWDDQLRTFRGFAEEHGGRPHWGKEATCNPAYLRAHFPKLEPFAALRGAYDPENKFANHWLRHILSIPAAT